MFHPTRTAPDICAVQYSHHDINNACRIMKKGSRSLSP